MQIKTFLFSNKLAHKLALHGLFWIAFSLYIFFFMYGRSDYTLLFDFRTYGIRFQNVLIFILAALPSTIFFLYFFTPRILMRGKWILAGFIFLGFVLLFLIYGWLIVKLINPLILPGKRLHDSSALNKMAYVIYNCFINPLLPIAFAVSISLTKSWFLRTKEALLMVRRKKSIELNLLKMKTNPQLIVASLKQLKHCLSFNATKFPELLISLSDILSYTIYESEGEFVPLEKEMAMIRTYMDSQLSALTYSITGTMKYVGDFGNYFISPLVLLPILQCLFGLSMEPGQRPRKSFDLIIKAIDGTLLLRLIIYNPLPMTGIEFQKAISDSQLQERLNVLYAGRHGFQIGECIDDSTIELNLSLELSDSTSVAGLQNQEILIQ